MFFLVPWPVFESWGGRMWVCRDVMEGGAGLQQSRMTYLKKCKEGSVLEVLGCFKII